MPGTRRGSLDLFRGPVSYSLSTVSVFGHRWLNRLQRNIRLGVRFVVDVHDFHPAFSLVEQLEVEFAFHNIVLNEVFFGYRCHLGWA